MVEALSGTYHQLAPTPAEAAHIKPLGGEGTQTVSAKERTAMINISQPKTMEAKPVYPIAVAMVTIHGIRGQSVVGTGPSVKPFLDCQIPAIEQESPRTVSAHTDITAGRGSKSGDHIAHSPHSGHLPGCGVIDIETVVLGADEKSTTHKEQPAEGGSVGQSCREPATGHLTGLWIIAVECIAAQKTDAPTGSLNNVAYGVFQSQGRTSHFQGAHDCLSVKHVQSVTIAHIQVAPIVEYGFGPSNGGGNAAKCPTAGRQGKYPLARSGINGVVGAFAKVEDVIVLTTCTRHGESHKALAIVAVQAVARAHPHLSRVVGHNA